MRVIITYCVIMTVIVYAYLPFYQPRVIYGIDDDNKYPYVVLFLQTSGNFTDRLCTGSLITETWVLTAAHCVEDPPELMDNRIRYGDMTVPMNSTAATFSKILKYVIHPQYLDSSVFEIDIALVLVQRILMRKYGKLSAADYKTLIGLPVKYAGYGVHYNNQGKKYKSYSYEQLLQLSKELLIKPLQVGEGIVNRCADELSQIESPIICVVPKCAKKLQEAMSGDSGGPLFHDDKIIGVMHSGISLLSLETDDPKVLREFNFIPVSIHMDWITRTISKESNQMTPTMKWRRSDRQGVGRSNT